MPRAKVVHIVTRLELGGAQQNTLHTVRSLDRARFSPLLICGPGGLLDDEARRDLSFRTLFLDSLAPPVAPALDLLALFELTKLLLAERPEIVHTHSSKAGVLGRLAARLAGVPVIVHTFHGFGFHDRQSAAVRCAYLAAERLAAAFSHALIFVSRANIAYAQRHGLVD